MFQSRSFLKVFTIYGYGGHFGHATVMIWTNFRSPSPRRTYMKFDFDCPSGFWEDDVWKCWLDEIWVTLDQGQRMTVWPWPQAIHMIFSWTEIGRSAIFGREIGLPDREIFSRQKIFNFSVKNCYLLHCRSTGLYGQLEVDEICQFHSSMFWKVLYIAKCAATFYNPYLKIDTKSA